MAASAVQNIHKSSKKKAAKMAQRTESPAPSIASGAADKANDSQDETFESPYMRELQKYVPPCVVLARRHSLGPLTQ